MRSNGLLKIALPAECLSNDVFSAQGGFNEFLARCENLDFDVDSARGRLSAREVRNLKVRQEALPLKWQR